MANAANSFPTHNPDALAVDALETDLDNNDFILVCVDGIWKKCSLQILAEAVEDFLV